MAIDYTKQTVGSGFQSVDVINENFEDIETAAEDALSRSGNTPNEMGATLDMNSNRIINLPTATSASEPVTKGQFDTASGALNPIGFQVEKVTATAGQTVVNFSSITYTVGGSTLMVFINGVYQDPSSYTETDEDTITLSAGMDLNDVLSVVVLSLT